MTAIREEADLERPIVVNGAIGPRGDGYVPGELMTPEEAEEYHAEQIATFAGTDADMVAGITMNYFEEAIGLARAAAAQGMPVVISFTVETDGRLITGQDLRAAIEGVDDASARAPIYYMINCAHPTHFKHVLDDGEWLSRIAGIRANASTLSHAQLDEADELDAGDPAELASGYAELNRQLPNLHVVGGCCGTDHRHVAAISSAV
jgi:homocysteine S-methyltransferase